MPGLKIYSSNSQEILVEELAEVISAISLSSPFTREIIVVQSKGMERWVSMELARIHGICANCCFSYPNNFARQVFEEFIEDFPDDSAFEPDFLAWKVMKHLPDHLKTPGFESLKSYLDNDKNGLKLYQISRHIAETFDQYLVYRPEMILGWVKNPSDNWQSLLWKSVVGDEEITHRAAHRELFLKEVKNRSHKLTSLPERISVFGISALPPFHLQILAELSAHIDINMFLMNPCREYWEDIVSDREVDKFTFIDKVQTKSFIDLHLEQGNPLLASMGTLGREFFSLINDFDPVEQRRFVDTGNSNMLSVIQSDILNLNNRSEKSGESNTLNPDDRSIQFHSCHSPLREIEILHDNLLSLFEADSNLNPKDILVMAPDIELYTPFIQAVFSRSSNSPEYIPYSIADRSYKKENPVIDTFQALLNLYNSRFNAAKVLAVLESPCIHRKFGLQADDLDLIYHWVQQTQIRWGIDSTAQSQIDQPSFKENTWQSGLERLLLGYAMPGNHERMFNDILPYDDIEGENSLVLGKFAEFIKQLFSYVDLFNRTHSLSDWVDYLISFYDRFILSDRSNEMEIQVIYRAINKLAAYEEISGYSEKVSLDIIKSYLDQELENQGYGYGFIAGAVTFCSMLPMRSIPFKVICCLGLNDTAFPRQSRQLSFDLIAKNPRPGDRSRRNDDRYLFLEAILSARNYLYISYVGQSIEDNSLIPPSVVVSELLDYIEQSFTFADKNIIEQVVTKHRLQAFNSEYFTDNTRLFSYSTENNRAGQALLADHPDPATFISTTLPEPEQEYRSITVENLYRFFNNPSKYLLRKRLGINLDLESMQLEEREPYDITGLDKYMLEKFLMKKHLEGANLDNLYPVVRASGALPHGTAGKCVFDDFTKNVRLFADLVQQILGKEKLQPLEVRLDISGFVLTGLIDNIYPDMFVTYRTATVKPKDKLKIWIYHLILNALTRDDYPLTSICIGTDKAFAYRPVDNSINEIEKLLEVYWDGLTKPARFFPRSSLKYVEDILNSKSNETALRNAEFILIGNEYNQSELKDPYFELCFKYDNPLNDEFKTIAEKVYKSMLNYQEEIKLPYERI